jgi:hypothetical protein
MTRYSCLAIALALCTWMAAAQTPVRFEDHFVDSTLRIDYYHIGNSTEDFITLDHVYRQGIWAGSTANLVDPFMNGRYAVRVYDAAAGTLLFVKAYDAYFGEYKTTDPAKKGIRRTYHESVLVPFPKHPVRVDFEQRDRTNIYRPLFTMQVDPSDYHIITESTARGDSVYNLEVNGAPHAAVDILILGEGYTAAEQGKFAADLAKYRDVFFGWEPYKSNRKRFNFRGVFTPSPQSGTDEPRQGTYRRTALESTFNSLDSDRYLLVEDNRVMRDVAAQAPYDALLIMVNSKRYGGGGLHNVYCAFTSDGTWNEHVMLHEFGHSFAGLADEYYTRDVSYEEFLPPGIEPSEANLTALLDPANLKWKDLVTPGISIPTEWGQAAFDSLGILRDSLSARRSALRGKADPAAIALVDTQLAQTGRRISRFFLDHPLRGKVGAFEGGGYVPKGFYRPTVNSLMNAFNTEERTYYPVNERAILRVIRYYAP